MREFQRAEDRRMGWDERRELKKEIKDLWREARDLEFAIGKQILAQRTSCS